MTTGKRIATLRETAGVTQQQLADYIGRNVDTIRRWESDIRSPRINEAEKIAEFLKVSLNDIISETKTPYIIQDTTFVPVIDSIICASAGEGNYYDNIEWNEIGMLPIENNRLIAYSWQGADFKIILADGDSMEPRIFDGDKILFASNIEIDNGNIAIVDYNGKILVKGVIFNKDGTITLRSFNKDYKDLTVDGDQIKIVGKVLKAFSDRDVPSIL